MIKKNNNKKPPVTNGDDLKNKTEQGVKWNALLTSQPPPTSLAELLVTQSCLTLCNLMDRRPPGSSVHGILQARILEWVTIPFSRASSQSGNQIQVSCLADRFFTFWVAGEDLQRSQMNLAHFKNFVLHSRHFLGSRACLCISFIFKNCGKMHIT